jgi:hypothetical protein
LPPQLAGERRKMADIEIKNPEFKIQNPEESF